MKSKGKRIFSLKKKGYNLKNKSQLKFRQSKKILSGGADQENTPRFSRSRTKAMTHKESTTLSRAATMSRRAKGSPIGPNKSPRGKYTQVVKQNFSELNDNGKRNRLLKIARIAAAEAAMKIRLQEAIREGNLTRAGKEEASVIRKTANSTVRPPSPKGDGDYAELDAEDNYQDPDGL